MLTPSFSIPHMSATECPFTVCQRLLPGAMGLVSAGWCRDEIPVEASKDTQRRGQFGVLIRGIPVLQNGPLNGIGVQSPVGISIVSDKAFHGLHPHFSPTIAVGKSY